MTSEQSPLWCQVPDHLQMRQEFERQPPDPEEDQFRHSGWAPLRKTIFTALLAAGASASRIDAFVKCGAGCSVWFNANTGEVRLKGSYCHDRFCRPCAAARGRELQAAIHSHVPEGVALRFVTLTLRHSALPLQDVLQRLRDSFQLLRNRKWWKDRVTGGVCVLEVKLSKTGQWHPHLHMILQGSYMDQKELSKLWLAITGDSYIVDVRRVADKEADCRDLSKYLSKYISKPAGLDVFQDQAKLVEYIVAMKGQRLMNFLGSWRGIMSEDDDAPDESLTAANGWERISTLPNLFRRAAEHDPVAMKLLALVQRSAQPLDTAPELIPDEPPPNA